MVFKEIYDTICKLFVYLLEQDILLIDALFSCHLVYVLTILDPSLSSTGKNVFTKAQTNTKIDGNTKKKIIWFLESHHNFDF